MDQPPRQTNGRTAYQSDSVNQVLPSKTHQVDSKQDYGPLVWTNLTLKKILHRVVKLILQATLEPYTQQTTAAYPHCLHVGVAGTAGRVVPCGRRPELLLLWGPSFLHWVNMSHLSSRVEPHWWSLLAGRSCIELQPVACSWGWGLHWIATSGMFLGYRPALNCDLHWIATRTCLGSSSAARVGRRISVLTRGSVGGPALPSTPIVLKVGALRVVLALARRRVAVVGTVARRWCGCRGFAGRTGLQTRTRTAAQWPWRQT